MVEQRSTDLSGGVNSQPTHAAAAGDGMAAPASSGRIALDPPPDIRSRSGQPLPTTGDKLPAVSSTPGTSGPSATPSTSSADSAGFPPYLKGSLPPAN
jgi:hypothetical protein